MVMQQMSPEKSINEQRTEIEYLECCVRPKLEASLQRFINKYGGLMTEYHPQSLEELSQIIERAYNERLDMIIQQEYLGYFVLAWKGSGVKRE